MYAKYEIRLSQDTLMWIFFCYIFSWKKNKEVKMYQPNIEPKSLVCCFVWLIFAVAWRSAPNTHPVCVSSPLRIIFVFVFFFNWKFAIKVVSTSGVDSAVIFFSQFFLVSFSPFHSTIYFLIIKFFGEVSLLHFFCFGLLWMCKI